MSFKETYYKYYPELFRYGRQLNIDNKDVEDMVQETFMRYYIELKRGVIFGNVRAWLYKVMLNLARTKNSTESLHNAKISSYKLSEVDMDLNEILVQNERRAIVFRFLEQLPKKDKDLLILYNNGLKYAEIAEILDMNPKSVGTCLVRTIKKLKSLLIANYHELFR